MIKITYIVIYAEVNPWMNKLSWWNEVQKKLYHIYDSDFKKFQQNETEHNNYVETLRYS